MAADCKLSLLDLGRMDVDDGFFIRGATAAVQSNPQLDTRIVNAGPGGFSVSIKRAPRD